MEKGILFSKAEKATCEYEKSFCFGETPRSVYWDRTEQASSLRREVSHEEAQYFDEIMDKIISIQFS